MHAARLSLLQVGYDATLVLFFDCPEEVLEKRLLGRNQVSCWHEARGHVCWGHGGGLTCSCSAVKIVASKGARCASCHLVSTEYRKTTKAMKNTISFVTKP